VILSKHQQFSILSSQAAAKAQIGAMEFAIVTVVPLSRLLEGYTSSSTPSLVLFPPP
jgi:hypothetical protein